MPRFNPDRYRPTDESSPGYKTLDSSCLVLNVALDGYEQRIGCPCGCGEMPLGDRAIFRMGHDARLRGKLIRAYLTGTRVRIHMDGILSDPKDAYEIAARYEWEKYLDAAVLKREGKNRELLRKALGSERLIKVGRWEFTGQVAAVYRTGVEDMFLVEYVNKAGDIRQARVPATEAPMASEGAS